MLRIAEIDEIDFHKMGGLIPAIIQDSSTSAVLMLGFMNREALVETVKSSKVTFFSRSKQRLWTKGEGSGNFLMVQKITLDCDKDTILISVVPEGPVCHTGTKTCFGEDSPSSASFLHTLESVISERAISGSSSSYTNSLLNSGIQKIAQKVGEEAVETILEAVNGSDERLISESADLIYHWVVLLKSRNVLLVQVEEELKRRHKPEL
jgi:phosphoribosyl-ATP pyrophosphohydrolase/phosphoribosyl-AMP cyclohydrolase